VAVVEEVLSEEGEAAAARALVAAEASTKDRPTKL